MADSLINSVTHKLGLTDFGEEHWREPFSVLTKALDDEAELTLMGRLMARSDLLNWLESRLLIEDTLKRNPQITEQAIIEPVFIAGLPRSGDIDTL